MTHSFASPFLQELSDRGLIYQASNLEALDALISRQGTISLYIGFDATAPSFHVGHLIPIMVLRIAQRHGHKPIVIMGGGTTKLGDPSFKDTARPLLGLETIAENIRRLKTIFSRYLKFAGQDSNALMLDNNDWLGSLNYLDFLRDYGRHFSVNRMLTFEGVKMRLDREQSLSFLEFNYMILQGYDFLELYRKYNCVLQLGGSDQWGNIISGTDLIRRAENKEAFCITYPLLTTSSGKKMGKTEQGAVWLNQDQFAPFDFWQFWRNVDDSDVIRFLKIFTDLTPSHIDSYQHKTGSDLNNLKILLADEVTKLAHREEALIGIHKSVQQVFQDSHDQPIEVEGYDNQGNAVLKTGFPIVKIDLGILEKGLPAFELACSIGVASSNGEARRLIRGGGISINGQKIMDENTSITSEDMVEPGIIKVSVGKKRHLIVQLWR